MYVMQNVVVAVLVGECNPVHDGPLLSNHCDDRFCNLVNAHTDHAVVMAEWTFPLEAWTTWNMMP